MNIKELFSKVENAEQDFYKTEFVSPVVSRGKVFARILGLIQEFWVLGDFEGWAILKPCREIPKQYTGKYVRVVGSPNLLQIEKYLEQLPNTKVTLSERRKDGWYGFTHHRPSIEVRVLLADGVSLFDTVVVHYDPVNYWFAGMDRSINPSFGEYLREASNKSTSPDKLDIRGLIPFQRKAYRWQYFLHKKQVKEVTLETIKRAVEHGTSKFLSYIERKDAYVVTFSLDSEEFRATITKKDFTVMSAGICLSGEDRKFDIQSLTGVIKEGQDRDLIHREDGDNYEDE